MKKVEGRKNLVVYFSCMYLPIKSVKRKFLLDISNLQ